MNKNNKHNSSRRDFAKRLALISTAPMLTTFCTTTESQTVTPQAKDIVKSKAKALSDLTQLQYGQNINKEDLPKIEAGIAHNLEIAEKLKSIKLENGDEPTTIFRA